MDSAYEGYTGETAEMNSCWAKAESDEPYDPTSICAASLEAIKGVAGLSPREVRFSIAAEFPNVTMSEVLLAMQFLCKQGLIRESDDSGVFEYSGNLK